MIVDSCILIDVSRGNQAALNFLLHQNERPAISMLTVVEVMRGVRKPSEETLFGALFEKMVCVPVDLDISLRAGDYLRRYGPSHGVDLVDAVIVDCHLDAKAVGDVEPQAFPHVPRFGATLLICRFMAAVLLTFFCSIIYVYVKVRYEQMR